MLARPLTPVTSFPDTGWTLGEHTGHKHIQNQKPRTKSSFLWINLKDTKYLRLYTCCMCRPNMLHWVSSPKVYQAAFSVTMQVRMTLDLEILLHPNRDHSSAEQLSVTRQDTLYPLFLFLPTHLQRRACSHWATVLLQQDLPGKLGPAQSRCLQIDSGHSGPVSTPDQRFSYEAAPQRSPEAPLLPPYTDAGRATWSPPFWLSLMHSAEWTSSTSGRWSKEHSKVNQQLFFFFFCLVNFIKNNSRTLNVIPHSKLHFIIL